MDWLLALLALINLVAMAVVYLPRDAAHRSIPWAVFGISLIATELAWVWLPLQALLAMVLISVGALDSGLGALALLVLLATWPGLGWNIWLSTKAEAAIEDGLVEGLGPNYRSQIPPQAQARLRHAVRFSDWCKPLSFARPGVEVIRHIPYGPAGIRQQLDIYRPVNLPADGCPVLLQIHGGGWVMGDKGGQALPLMYHLASKGWICVAVNYRLSPSVGFPTHLHDCKSALCWIRKHGREYGMNPDFVAVTGGSAGGHLTALMGLTANLPELQPDHPNIDTSVQAVVPFYGVYDFLTRHQQSKNPSGYQEFLTDRVLHQSATSNPDLWRLASPIDHISPAAPPFMILHGTLDSLVSVKEARVFREQLQAVSGNPVVYAELEGAEHAWELFHSLRTEHSIDGVHRFLEWVLAGRAAKPQTTTETGNRGTSTGRAPSPTLPSQRLS
ncbi:alpha/beta hydrolase [Pseudomaricurvus alcaniphilus]|uniref:alpha/beta hydrolase n=1 Tax=Pseudomaricurvus alcaniphilus TaxID=1166482 RepID=UPI00140A7536|nr:alpha/beta hydrolase [Pseudomaricurvus alcaniphilus]NHN38651.1 alpha/beta hydrolase [Pseudomaricurvus alcaniphilus]